MRARWFVIAGIVFLTGQYLWCVSYWQDESALLLNIIHKSPSQLAFGPLDAVPLAQAAPPLFLLVLKGLVSGFGVSPYVTRLPPFLCGAASMPLFVLVSRRTIGRPATLWATALFVLSDNFLFESCNVKPYSGDVLAVLLILYASGRGDETPALKRLKRAAVVATVVFWFSYAAVFAFAAVSLAIFLSFLSPLPVLWERARVRGISSSFPDATRSEDPHPNPLPAYRARGNTFLARYAILNLAPLVSFLLVWHFCIRPQHVPMLDHFWSDRMVDWSSPLMLPAWLAARVWELSLYTERLPIGGVLLLPAILGAFALRRELPRWKYFAVVLPFVLTFIAAAAHEYPLGGGRVTLFLLPFEMMLAGAGLSAIFIWNRHLTCAGVAIVIAAMAFDLFALAVPRINGDSRDVIAYLKSHRQADEPIYVAEGMGEDFLLAWPDAPGKIVLNITRPDQIADQRFWLAAAFKPRRGAGAADSIQRALQAKSVEQADVRGGTARLLQIGPGTIGAGTIRASAFGRP